MGEALGQELRPIPAAGKELEKVKAPSIHIFTGDVVIPIDLEFVYFSQSASALNGFYRLRSRLLELTK